MMKLLLCAVAGLGLITVHAAPSVSGWTPVFRGIDLATGTNTAGWVDVTPGPVKLSPYCVSNPPASVFFRLRQ